MPEVPGREPLSEEGMRWGGSEVVRIMCIGLVASPMPGPPATMPSFRIAWTRAHMNWD